jgi:diguanylate cyclase (GGDEF)-like protein/PAS domain S-box-containing protein
VQTTTWVVLHAALSVFAAAVALLSIRSARRTSGREVRVGFTLLAAWSGFYALGEAFLASWLRHGTWSDATNEGLTVSIGTFAAAVTVGGVAAWWLLRTTYERHALVRAALDAWIAAGSLSALCWGLLVHAGLERAQHSLGLGLVMVAGILDITVLAAAVAVAVTRTGLARGQAALVALGLLGLIIRDIGYGAALLGHPGWHGVGVAGTAMAFVMFGGSALLEPEATPLDPYVQRRWVGRATIPYILATVSGVVLAAHVLLGASLGDGTLILALSVVVALVARMSITIVENAALLRELAASEDHFRSLVLNSNDAIVVASQRGEIRYVSPAGEQLLGVHAERVTGMNLLDLVHPADRRGVLQQITPFLRGVVSTAHVDARVRDGRGGWPTLESTISRTEHGMLVNARDVTDRRHLQERLRYLAYHDHLTGLPNRALLVERLRDQLQRTDPGPAALMFLDLDGFKRVNDSWGHDAGDAVLTEAARRLVRVTGQKDLVARFGGDEFAVLVAPRDKEAVLLLARSISTTLSLPHVVDGRVLRVGPSIGVAFADPSYDADRLIRHADVAMYEAKQRGERIAIFRPRLLARAVTRASISSVLTRRPWGENFALLFQPVVALDTGRVVAVEALVRFRTAAGILMTPAALVKLAEASGRIVPLGRWIITEALAQTAAWRRAGHEIEIAVNLSVGQVTNPDIVQVVEDALQESGVPASELTLEITEGMLIDDVDAGIERLNALQRIGVRLALDDFGTRFSSLNYLRLLPVDGIKVDRSFVAALDEDPQAEPVLSAVVRLGRELGLTVTAEGIERSSQRDTLAGMQCHRGQGFFFSGPLEPAGITHLLRLGVVPPADLPFHRLPTATRVPRIPDIEMSQRPA